MPVRKTRFYIFPVLLVLILLIPACAAFPTEQQTQTGFFFIQTVNEGDLRAINLMVMPELEINGEHKAIIISLGGNISVNAPVDGIILTLFAKTVSTEKVKYGIIDLKHVSMPFNLIVGLAALAVFKDFMEQSAAYFEKNKRGALKFGIYGYIMTMLLIGVFLISAAGALIAAAGILFLSIITLAGHIPVSVALGYRLREKLGSYNIYILFAIGSIIIDLFRFIPFAGDILTYVVLPALSLGVFSVFIIHSIFYKAYVRISFEKDAVFNRERINSIIMQSTDD